MRVTVWIAAATLTGCGATGTVQVADPAERQGGAGTEDESTETREDADETEGGDAEACEARFEECLDSGRDPAECERHLEACLAGERPEEEHNPCDQLAHDCLDLGVSEETCRQAHRECEEAHHEDRCDCDEDECDRDHGEDGDGEE